MEYVVANKKFVCGLMGNNYCSSSECYGHLQFIEDKLYKAIFLATKQQ